MGVNASGCGARSAVTLTSESVQISVPLSLLGNDDGR